MAFDEVQFPVDIAYGSSGGPEFSTNVVMLQNGYEKRNSNWSVARARYNVAHGVKTQAQLDALIAFFRARKGKARGFRFKDWSDYKIVGQVIDTGNAIKTEFQIIKNYTSGGITEARIVRKIVSGTVQVYVDAVLQTSGVTIDYNTGKITFSTPPANGGIISLDAEFDVPVRFDTDRLSASLDNYGTHSWLDIPVLEIRL